MPVYFAIAHGGPGQQYILMAKSQRDPQILGHEDKNMMMNAFQPEHPDYNMSAVFRTTSTRIIEVDIDPNDHKQLVEWVGSVAKLDEKNRISIGGYHEFWGPTRGIVLDPEKAAPLYEAGTQPNCDLK